MAFINGVIGVSRKKVGEIVAFKRAGKTIARKYLGSGEISNPNTNAQAAHRARFALIAETIAMNSAFFNKSFSAFKRFFTGYAAAIHYNWDNLITGVYPTYTVDYASLIPSKGSLVGVDAPSATANVSHGVDVTWTDNSGSGNASADDLVSVVLWVPTIPALNTIFSYEDVAARNAGTASITGIIGFAGLTGHVWICLRKSGTRKYSTAQYLGTVTL